MLGYVGVGIFIFKSYLSGYTSEVLNVNGIFELEKKLIWKIIDLKKNHKKLLLDTYA